ncbi:zinc finger domain-containing protein [Streptomyces sp. NPDC005004]
MDRREIAALLAYIGRLDPRLARTDQGDVREQLDQWHELLGDVPMATPHGWDARDAARRHYRTSPYPIAPADIGRPWDAYRRDRIGRHVDPTPSADPDDQAAWTAELVSTRHAVAIGSAQPMQDRAISSRRSTEIDPKLEERLREVGSCIPPAARAALAPYRAARAARTAAAAPGQPDALSIGCEQCGAQPGKPCLRRKLGPSGAMHATTPRTIPHGSRLTAAQAQQPAMG